MLSLPYFRLSYPTMTNGNTIALTTWTFVGKVMSLFFYVLSRFVIAFLPRSKHLLISWLQSLYTVILEPKKKKEIYHRFHVFPSWFALRWWDQMILTFWMLSFKPAFSPFSFTLIKRLFSSSLLSAIRVGWSAYLSRVWEAWIAGTHT